MTAHHTQDLPSRILGPSTGEYVPRGCLHPTNKVLRGPRPLFLTRGPRETGRGVHTGHPGEETPTDEELGKTDLCLEGWEGKTTTLVFPGTDRTPTLPLCLPLGCLDPVSRRHPLRLSVVRVGDLVVVLGVLRSSTVHDTRACSDPPSLSKISSSVTGLRRTVTPHRERLGVEGPV